MYIIELLIKCFSKKKANINQQPNDDSDYENCEHLFMPIDSSNEILSCAKCGLLVRKSELKNANFFLNKPEK